MAQQLLIKIIDNESCDEDRTPFLMLWQPWGGYTVSALETVQGILEVFERVKEEISSIMHRPNHKDELADFLVNLMHSYDNIWMPQCPIEVEGLGYNMEEDRESYWKMTKLVLMANGLQRSAALVNKSTIWDPEGILMATDETIKSTLKGSEAKSDVFDVEIGLDSDASPGIIFRVMAAFEPTEKAIEIHYVKSSRTLMCKDSIKKYCDEMPITVWNEFRKLINFMDTKGRSLLVNKKEKFALGII